MTPTPPPSTSAAPPAAGPPPQPGDAGQRPLGLSPEAPDYVVSWAKMTSGIEDYVRWREMFEGRSGKDAPPFRRGRIWARQVRRAQAGAGRRVFDDAPSAWVCGYGKSSGLPSGSMLYLRHGKETQSTHEADGPTAHGPPKGYRPTAKTRSAVARIVLEPQPGDPRPAERTWQKPPDVVMLIKGEYTT